MLFRSNYGSNVTRRKYITTGTGWPDNFIHFRDISQGRVDDLAFIKTKNTSSGKVELHVLDANRLGGPTVISTTTGFSPLDANNGWFQMADWTGDGRPDLTFIKTKNTSSGKVELHVLDANRLGGPTVISTTTGFSPLDADNGWFQMAAWA